MSGSGTVSLPLDVKALMTVPVLWEAFTGFDVFAQPNAYAAGITLYCWQELHGLSDAGMKPHRHIDETIVEPIYNLFFDGDDARVLTFTLYDRFTPNGVFSSSQQRLQATFIETMFGPNFDNVNPWLVAVSL